LDSANAFFPDAALTENDVVSAWAGIRPLLPAAAATPGAVSREHAVTTSERGVISITGGKLTTYRVMARDVVDAVMAQLGRRTGGDPTRSTCLAGGDFRSLDTLIATASRATNDVSLSEHLVGSYGSRWPDVWN